MNDKQLCQMTVNELRELAMGDTGLPLPEMEAPREAYYAWMVAVTFISCCQTAPDMATGQREAVSILLDGTRSGQGKLVPFVERALGRKLTEEEMANVSKSAAEAQPPALISFLSG